MYEIWKYLNDADQYIRSFEEFKIEFENPEMQKKLFDGMTANNLIQGGSFEGFQSEYFAPEKSSISTVELSEYLKPSSGKTIVAPPKQATPQQPPVKTPKFQAEYEIPQVEDIVSQESVEQIKQNKKK